jgi:hypothetical protein
MNKILIAATVLMSVGCNFRYRSIPDSGISMAHADYTVLGTTTAEACGTYILGIDFGHLLNDQEGTAAASAASPLGAIMGLLPGGGGTPEASRALYDGLEQMPEATNLYAPRINTTVTGLAPFGIPFFGKRCSEIIAKGVKIGKGPVPNAN